MFGPEFYPTPRDVAVKMLARVSREATNFLEPSAGRGDLAKAILGGTFHEDERYGNNKHVDCIESHPELAAILRGHQLPVVGFDFLTFPGVCYYDAIVMNPPFSNGDEHLLRAWEFLHDGEIVCLLNAETINNPHTARRRQLLDIISKNGDVTQLGNCFHQADRQTNVEVVMVYLKKQAEDDSAALWGKKDSAEKPVDAHLESPEDCAVAIRNNLGNMEHWYNMANQHMFTAFEHLRKAHNFLEANGISTGCSDESEYAKVCAMAFRNINPARAAFSRMHRRAAWKQVFNKMQFRRWLDKKQTDEFLRDVETNSDIPFTADNINTTLENVFLQRGKLFEKSVANVFDELTKYHKDNTRGAGAGGGGNYSGWKSNSAYKVNRKIVFPYGVRFDKMFGFQTHYSGVIDVYNDLDRIMCMLSGENFEECATIGKTLTAHLDNRAIFGYATTKARHLTPDDKSCESRFFDIKFWQKGTLHLMFRDRDLWERFNVTAAKGKKWLGEDHD